MDLGNGKGDCGLFDFVYLKHIYWYHSNRILLLITYTK